MPGPSASDSAGMVGVPAGDDMMQRIANDICAGHFLFCPVFSRRWRCRVCHIRDGDGMKYIELPLVYFLYGIIWALIFIAFVFDGFAAWRKRRFTNMAHVDDVSAVQRTRHVQTARGNRT